MRAHWLVTVAVLAGPCVAGCGRSEPPSPPRPPAAPPARAEPPATASAPAPATENLIQVTARIEPASPAEGFQKGLVIELSVPGSLHWNNEAWPVSLTLTAPAGVRLSKTSIEIPNPPEQTDTKPRSVSVGLTEDAAAGTNWRLGVDLVAFVCYDVGSVCLRQAEKHTVTPKRGT